MINTNKINGKQKEAMAQYMAEHPYLAKNLVPNCRQGRATSKRLWDQLTLRLNSLGPPVKDAKLWRKVFVDQKFNAKKRTSFKKASKPKPVGGPCEEMILTPAVEQIIEVTRIGADVEGLSSVKTYGKTQFANATENDDFLNERAHSLLHGINIDDGVNEYIVKEEPMIYETKYKEINIIDGVDEYMVKEEPRIYERKDKVDTNFSMVKPLIDKTAYCQRELLVKTESILEIVTSHAKKVEEYAREINGKIDRLLLLKERSLKIKEEEHSANMAIKDVELKIKSLELEMLKQKTI